MCVAAQRAGHRHAVVAVAHEVQVADPVDGDRRHGLAAALGLGDPLPARRACAPEVGPEAAVEVRARGRRCRRSSRARSTAARALARRRAPERLDDLLERQDQVDVAGRAGAGGAPGGQRARRRARGKSSWASVSVLPVSRGDMAGAWAGDGCLHGTGLLAPARASHEGHSSRRSSRPPPRGRAGEGGGSASPRRDLGRALRSCSKTASAGRRTPRPARTGWLVVQLERAVVEVRRADGRPRAVDHQRLRVEHRRLVLEDAARPPARSCP